MELRIAYKQMDSTPSIEERIREKATKLKRFFHGKISIDWICSVEKDAHHSDVTVSGDHFRYHASSVDDTLYKTIDDVMQKLQRQLEKKNNRVKEKIHHKH
jgi:putative sigma-54 modulation protein